MIKTALQHYKVKLNKDHYFKRGNIYLDAVGTEEQTLPKHGEVIATPLNSKKYNLGDTVYFLSSTITHTKVEEDGELFLYLREGDIIASKVDGKWRNGSFIVANRIEKEEVSEGGIILAKTIEQEYYTQQFIRIDTWDKVWTYKDSDFIIDYEKEVAFLREDYIVFNETEDKAVGDWIIIEEKDKNDDWVKTESGIYTPQKLKVQRGRAKVARPNKYNLTGEIIYQKTNYNKVQDTPYSATKYEHIYVCYETN